MYLDTVALLNKILFHYSTALANSVDQDQMWHRICIYSVCSGLSVQTLWVNMVIFFVQSVLKSEFVKRELCNDMA